MKQTENYEAFVRILNKHLRPAMGCTEPIAIAYAAALAREALGTQPENTTVRVSGNIIKNAKSVTVPNTNGKKGIPAAVAAGIIAGDAARELQVIASVTDEQRAQIEAYLALGTIDVALKEDARLFDILITVEAGGHTASARIADRHTNVVLISKDGNTLRETSLETEDLDVDPDEDTLTISEIYDFAKTCDIADVAPILDPQIRCNFAVAEEGLSGKWGAAVGRVILDNYDAEDPRIRAKAYAAAGSDARMAGCELPVIINSGSGNQGITVSVPIIVMARAMNASDEELYRALVLSNLIAIHQKMLIGCLSAYCGAVSAGCAAGCGIAFLHGGDLRTINHTLVNSLAILSGTICDGAKASCAAKIASAIDAAFMGYHMAMAEKQFRGGDGIVKKGVENTIANIGRLGKDGMRETDREILNIMIDC